MAMICRQIQDDVSGGSSTASSGGTSPPRKRKWHPKTFTGCLRCKERRIKCDEAHPGCLRCAKASLPCPGYKPPITRLFEPRPGPKFNCSDDKVNYEYFVHGGSAVLARFQLNSVAFWTQLAPQLGESNDAVKHGLLALGSIQAPLHRGTAQDQLPYKRPEWSTVALQHVSKAMHLLGAANPDTVPVEVVLACCIFFLAVEIWTEKKSYSDVHILAAHKILNGELKPMAGAALPSSHEIITVYKPMVDELVIQACTFGDDFPPPKSHLSYYYQLGHRLDSVYSILNWKDALDVLVQLLRCVLRVTSKPFSYPLRKTVSTALDEFGNVLERLRAAMTPASQGCTAEEEHSHLRLHHRVARIMLHTLGQKDESNYDAFVDEFDFVLRSCKTMVKKRVSTPQDRAPNITSPVLGLLPPLFFVATKCRDSIIRHKALDLLHDSAVSERHWTSCMATALAKFVVEQEEESLSGIVKSESSTAASKHVRLLHANFSSAERIVELQYSVFIDDEFQGIHEAVLPYQSHPSVQIVSVTATMSRKVLRACGYTGLILFTPPIECHCEEKSQSSFGPTDEESLANKPDIATLVQHTGLSSHGEVVLGGK